MPAFASSRMMRRGFKNAKKGFNNHRHSLMKKANTLHRLTGAHIAILMEYNDAIFLYQSDNRFATALANVSARQCFGPDHFDTVADRSSGNQIPHVLNQPPVVSIDITRLLSSTSSNFTNLTEGLPQNQDRCLNLLMSSLDHSIPIKCQNTAVSAKDQKTGMSSSAVHHEQKKLYPLDADFFSD